MKEIYKLLLLLLYYYIDDESNTTRMKGPKDLCIFVRPNLIK
jgi:hypothetical protein